MKSQTEMYPVISGRSRGVVQPEESRGYMRALALEHLDSMAAEKIPPNPRAASRQVVEYFYAVSFASVPLDSEQARRSKRATEP
jgi:hypothetical protein